MNRDRPITSLDHVHPLMVGLLELLPDVGEPWPSEDRRRHRLYAGHTPQDVRDRVDKVNDLMREAGYRGDRYKPTTQTG